MIQLLEKSKVIDNRAAQKIVLTVLTLTIFQNFAIQNLMQL